VYMYIYYSAGAHYFNINFSAGGQHGFHRWEKLFELKIFHYLIKKKGFSTRYTYTCISKLVSSRFLMLVLVGKSSFSLVFFTFITSGPNSRFHMFVHTCTCMLWFNCYLCFNFLNLVENFNVYSCKTEGSKS